MKAGREYIILYGAMKQLSEICMNEQAFYRGKKRSRKRFVLTCRLKNLKRKCK